MTNLIDQILDEAQAIIESSDDAPQWKRNLGKEINPSKPATGYSRVTEWVFRRVKKPEAENILAIDKWNRTVTATFRGKRRKAFFARLEEIQKARK